MQSKAGRLLAGTHLPVGSVGPALLGGKGQCCKQLSGWLGGKCLRKKWLLLFKEIISEPSLSLSIWVRAWIMPGWHSVSRTLEALVTYCLAVEHDPCSCRARTEQQDRDARFGVAESLQGSFTAAPRDTGPHDWGNKETAQLVQVFSWHKFL